MMTFNQGIVLVMGLIAFLGVILMVPYHLLFMRFCERIAELEERTDEFHSLKANEGSGMNQFEIEHKGMLEKREYLKFGDERLTELGDKLLKWRNKGLITVFIFFALLLTLVVIALLLE